MSKITNHLSQAGGNIEKFLIVMVTDLTNANASAKVESDAVKHRQHHDIVSLAIQLNNGVFIKSIDDDMIFLFNKVQDALSAAVEIQKDIDRLNMTNKFRNPILMRISLHCSKHMGANSEIPDDIIHFVQHIKSLALPGETFVSGNVCNAISNKLGFNFRPINQSLLINNESVSIYKVLWNPQEVELDNLQDDNSTPTEQPVATSKFKLLLIVLIPLLLVLLLTMRDQIMNQINPEQESRDIYQSIE